MYFPRHSTNTDQALMKCQTVLSPEDAEGIEETNIFALGQLTFFRGGRGGRRGVGREQETKKNPNKISGLSGSSPCYGEE